MSFSADWLALRADADRRARNPDLAASLAEVLFEHPSLNVLDLGSGTGANLAALAPLLGAQQTWHLADIDPTLLEQITPPEGIRIELKLLDLAENLETLFDQKPGLVTASAFFDLCGADIIDRIVKATVTSEAAFYTALTYDGRQHWAPENSLDHAMLDAFNAHQCNDKGLGPALGPGATQHLAEAFAKAGYVIQTGSSDWELAAEDDAELIAELARGTADALTPALGADMMTAWHTARHDAKSALIGHQDLLALPPS
jgi:hypothetical protein